MSITYKLGYLFCFSVLLLLGCQTQQPSPQTDSTDTLTPGSVYAQTNDVNNDLHKTRQNAITNAVAAVSPAVVGITVKQIQQYRQRIPLSLFFPEFYREQMIEREVESVGSGFFISSDGYIVTNDHVVQNAKEILVTLPDKRNLTAKLVGSDADTDIALLKVDGSDFPFIPFGDSDDLIVGEWVIALGNPFGLFALNAEPTVTVGVISAVDRDWGRTPEGTLYLDMIQTDASINHGNSGGPLVNAVGQVIGMNTFIFTGSQYESGSVGIGFAIPINRIRDVVEEIREKGGINRDYWLGIDQVIDLNRRIIRALDLKVNKGALITAIEPLSPAERAGLREYDVIIALNGKPVNNTDELLQIYRNLDLKVGTTLTFTVSRNGQKKDITVTLEQNPRRR